MLLSIEELLKGLGAMFDQRLDDKVLHERFRKREWRKDETFSDYMHQKIILANRVPIAERQLLGYIIDGIPNLILRNEARISGVSTKEELRARFEQVERWWDMKDEAKSGEGKYRSHRGTTPRDEVRRPEEGRDNKDRRDERRKRNCFSCGLPNHVSSNCPTKTQGPRCYKCGERGHIASRCVEQPRTVGAIDAQIARKKCVKEVSINGRKLEALIDTGSDISLMRAEQYFRVGAPKLGKKTIRFRGIGTDYNETLGEFDAVNIDEKNYPMHIHIVAGRLMEHELLLGTDFLNSVQVKMNAGEIIIEALESIPEDEEIHEVCQLDVVPDEVNSIDETHVLNTEYQDATESLVDKCKSEKASCKLELLAMEEAQRDEADIERIFGLSEKRGIDVDVARGIIPSREVDNDMRIVVPVSLKPRVNRQTHEREKHCSVAGTGALLDEEYQNLSIRHEIRKKSRRGSSRKRRKEKTLTYRENDLAIKHMQQEPRLKLANKKHPLLPIM
jgi:hypothetical protein